MKLLIKNGTIVDGTGQEAYAGSILIEDDVIKEIADTSAKFMQVDYTIDARGMVVCPGFIDTHSHSDLQLLLNPYIEQKVRQGITTEILGQDGISMAPLPEKYISSWRKNLAGLDGDSDLIDWHYKNTAGYLALLEKNGVGINEGYLVPHGNVRMEAMGLDNRKPTTKELNEMCAIVKREMEAGAFGLSTGLIYMPCAYAATEEIIALCKVVAEYEGVFVVHQRSEADTIISSMEEVIDIGHKSGVKVHFSHFKVCGHKNRRFIGQMLALLDKGKAEGVSITFDQYPYVAGSTMLGVILPPWAHDGGTDKLMARLQDKNLRKKMIYDMEHGLPGWDNFVDFAGLEQIFVTSVKSEKNRELVGKNLVEIGVIRNEDPYEATFDLLFEEENAVGMVDFYGKEEDIISFLTREEQNVCTDGILAGKPHPRVFGAFPKILREYVREKKVLSLTEAIQKMTAKPAHSFGIKKRGTIKIGNYADIVVFNPLTIGDRGTFINPEQYPEGIEYVLVNGEIVVRSGVYEKIPAGKVLRRF